MTTLNNSNPTQLARRASVHRTLIASRTVADVLASVKPPRNRELVELPSTATMEEAFDVLLAHDILSVPVYQQLDGNKKYLTIVSVLDLLKLLSGDAGERQVLLKPLSDAIGLTQESSKLVTVRPADTLEYVMQLLSQHGSHRVLVQAEDQSPVLLSQMDVARYLQAHNHELGKILDLTTPTIVEHARIRRGSPPTGDVASITYRMTAMEAFLKLAHSSLGALAIETDDDEHLLVGEVSPEQLRGLNRERFDALHKPVVMYLKSRSGDELQPPLTCHDRFTLSQIMTAFVLRKAHRLWWCDDEGHPKGVITLTDLIGTFLDQVV
ncbi:hypothetical protein K492DRAFT_172138 [Lichtheimia hyalospora FSU 10163]|nr:hypothetical protein K492DRAFT_172138 [Lichtheimia hyalospora FSU 10163]